MSCKRQRNELKWNARSLRLRLRLPYLLMLRIGGASSLAELELQEPACGKPAAAGSALAQNAEALHELRPLPVTQERVGDGVLRRIRDVTTRLSEPLAGPH